MKIFATTPPFDHLHMCKSTDYNNYYEHTASVHDRLTLCISHNYNWLVYANIGAYSYMSYGQIHTQTNYCNPLAHAPRVD